MSPLLSELGLTQAFRELLDQFCLILGGNVQSWVGVKFAAVVTSDLTKIISGGHSSDQMQAKQVAFWTPLINPDVLMSAM